MATSPAVILGLGFEVAATMVGTAGKQLVSFSARGEKAARTRKTLKVGGLLATTLVGPILDMAAYSLAPQSIVAPLNGLDIVWNTASAPFTLGEKLTKRHVLGTLLVVIGAAASSTLGPHEETPKSLEWMKKTFLSYNFAGYMAVFLACLVAGFVTMSKRPKSKGGKARGIALALVGGGIAGQMFFISSALGLIRYCAQTGDWSAWSHWLPYVVTLCGIACAVGNIPFMAKGLEEYEALFMVTIFEGCHIAVACVSGAVVLRELDSISPAKIVGYWCCVASIIVGLLVIQSTSVRPMEQPLAMKPLADEEDYLSDNGGMRSPVVTAAHMPVFNDGLEGGDMYLEDEKDKLTVVWAGSWSGVGLSMMCSQDDDESSADEGKE